MKCDICKEDSKFPHTTKTHIQDKLTGTIECYEREDYNHGNSTFAKSLLVDIDKLEEQLKAL